MPNHVDSLFAAVSILTRNSNIKQRLTRAYEEHLADIDGDELPPVLNQALADLRRMMTSVEPMNGEGSICATVRKMSIDEAEECARRVVSFYGDVIRYSDNTQESLPLQMRGQPLIQPVVPPFLVRTSRARSARSG